jgi:hypothetical protein
VSDKSVAGYAFTNFDVGWGSKNWEMDNQAPISEYLGRRSVSYSTVGAFGDDIVAYRKNRKLNASEALTCFI